MTSSELGPVSATSDVFETIEVFDGHTFAFAAHMSLLRTAAETLGFPEPDLDLIHDSVNNLLRAWGAAQGRLRVSWSVASSLHLSISPLSIRSDPAEVVTAEFVTDRDSPLCGLKSSGMSASVAALAAHPDADEVLLANRTNELIEGCSSNIFLVADGVLVTPPLSSGCRAGVTRELVLRAANAAGVAFAEEAIVVSHLDDFDEAFLTSTGRHVQPISKIDGRMLTGYGALTETISDAFAEVRRQADQ